LRVRTKTVYQNGETGHAWNYLYFSNLLGKEKDPKEQNKIINALKSGSIIHWQHINFYGEYDFTEKQIENEFDIERVTTEFGKNSTLS
jgi:hypothetical protein